MPANAVGYMTEYRQALRALGRCPRCGHHPPSPGKKWCGLCIEAKREAYQRKQAEREAQGLCHKCGRSPEPGKKHCQRCLDKSLRDSQAWQIRNYKEFRARDTARKRTAIREAKANGMCIGLCGRSATPGHSRCSKCLRYSRITMRRWRRNRDKAHVSTRWHLQNRNSLRALLDQIREA